MIGFENLGNTCYLNSALQLIIRIKDLTSIFNFINNKFDYPFDERMNTIIKFFQEYNEISNQSSKSQVVMNPKVIKKIMGKQKNTFDNYSQEDSSEFLIYFLDYLVSNIESVSKDSKQQIDDILNKSFKIETTQSIKCKVLSCLNVSKTKEITNFLFLEIIGNDVSDLDDCLSKSVEKEKLDGDNMYFCEKCNKKRKASKKSEITKCPKNIIVILKRFAINGSRYEKNNKQIDIPLIWQKKYRLTGMVYHSGSISGGHYVYVGLDNDKWYLFDDSIVSQIKKIDALNRIKNYSYIYHFEKI